MVNFDSFAIPQSILSALKEMGFETPSPIQSAAIPLLLQGRDIIGQAQTGTGKTAAFGIPLVAAALENRCGIVLVPTRELAQQVTAEIDRLGKHSKIEAIAIYGGAPFPPQARALASGRHSIIVATPGRLRDHMERGTLDVTLANMVVLDEADEMLKMGFAEEVEEILKAVGTERQTLLFSATMPPQIKRLAERYLDNPEFVSVRGDNDSVASAGTEQFLVVVEARSKVDALVRLLAVERPEGTIAFRHTRDGVEELTNALGKKGIPAEALHGGMAQAQREAVLARLRSGATKVLVATNVAARGLDVDTLTHVINFDTPNEAEAYVHRIGRTGRAGREGRSFLFASGYERNRVRNIERALGSRLPTYEIPTDDQVLDAIQINAREWLRSAPLSADPRHAALIHELIVDGADPVTLCAKLFGKLAAQEGFAPPALEPMRRSEAPRPRREMHNDAGRAPMAGPRVALMISVGRDDMVRPGDLVGALTNEGGLTGGDIGRIDILPRMSVVEVPGASVGGLMDTMQRSTIRGRPVEMKIANDWRFRTPARQMMHARN